MSLSKETMERLSEHGKTIDRLIWGLFVSLVYLLGKGEFLTQTLLFYIAIILIKK